MRSDIIRGNHKLKYEPILPPSVKGDLMVDLRIIVALLAAVVVSCQTVPLTKRSQLHLIPTSELDAMAVQNYRQVLDSATVIKGTPQTEMVQRVGGRIACAVERYFNDHGMSQRLKGYNWEFNLIKDTIANAWAMPGGKVAVYSGILPIAENDTGLAVVMAHEIGHVAAGHGDERMSQSLLVELGGLTVAEALRSKPQLTRQIFLGAYGAGAQLGVLLPYSRLQESEADHLGLIFMSMAGYDPNAAIAFWQRMMATQKGPAPPQFLSTHPGDQTRLQNIEKLIPKAMGYYQKTPCLTP
jgi:predicted Zn-dependent protease